MQLATLFTGRLVRLAAPRPEGHATFARFSENDQYLRIMDNDPARPVSAEAHAAWETPFLQYPAARAFEKAGFKPEGVWREMIQRDGKRFDVLTYGMLRHEWEALQSQPGA